MGSRLDWVTRVLAVFLVASQAACVGMSNRHGQAVNGLRETGILDRFYGRAYKRSTNSFTFY